MRIPQAHKEEINKTFSDNALTMMQKRYLLPYDEGGQETPADMFERVANALSQVERDYYGKTEEVVERVAKEFFEIMARKEYTPAGRTLTNAAGATPLIANCVVLRIEDSMAGIFQTLKEAALLQQAGCGLGFDLSEMRPANSATRKSRGRASGPVTFLTVYDKAFATIKQQSRHGANMAMMRVDHPDVLDFLSCKEQEGEIRNFNISVTVTDDFMEKLQKNPGEHCYCQFNGKRMKPHKVLRHPNGSVYDAVEVDITVKELFDKLVEHAWLNGEPGIAFIDTVNRSNPLPDLGPLAASNPCAEQFLHPYDNCNLGSINLAKFVTSDRKIDWERVRFVTRTAVRLMDNVIDRFNFPVPQVTELARKNRRIGLGIMGFADMLYQLGIRYDSPEGFATAEKIIGFINKEAYHMSQELAAEKGVFPNYEKSIFAKKEAPHSWAQEPGIGKPMRNAALTTVAPTGSISMMFDCSSGMEPNFALAYVKQDKDGHQYHYFNTFFQEALDTLELPKDKQKQIMDVVMEKGSIQSIPWLPKGIRDTFVVAMDISGKSHMEMQAAFQRHVDNSISKTINFPNSAPKEEVGESFIAAWKLGCKSCTVYREGSRQIQILNIGGGENIVSATEKPGGRPPSFPQAGILPRKRPEIMEGKTYRIKTGYGNLYITINDDEVGKPFEVFAIIGKSGGFFQEQSEAICRLASLALRAGIQVQEVISHLRGIRGPMPIFTEKGTVLSLPDAIGRVLQEHVGGVRQIENLLERPEKQEVFAFVKEENSSLADLGFMPGCPDCGEQLIMAEGCVRCKACGFSRCM